MTDDETTPQREREKVIISSYPCSETSREKQTSTQPKQESDAMKETKNQESLREETPEESQQERSDAKKKLSEDHAKVGRNSGLGV